MKKMRKLIPAFCMLLLSAVMLSTSTFAWFSMNTTVTANNMSITAKADNPFLQISKTSASAGFGTTVDMAKAGTDLKLITPLNAGTAVQYYADVSAAGSDTKTTPTLATKAADLLWGSATSSATDNAQIANVTTLVASGLEGNYYVSQELWLKVADEGANGTNLTASVAINGSTTNSIAASVRILIITENNKYVIFDKDGTVKAGNAVLAATLTAKNTENSIDGTVEKVTVYMYFDGTDSSTYTDNATDLSAVKVDVTFTID